MGEACTHFLDRMWESVSTLTWKPQTLRPGSALHVSHSGRKHDAALISMAEEPVCVDRVGGQSDDIFRKHLGSHSQIWMEHDFVSDALKKMHPWSCALVQHEEQSCTTNADHQHPLRTNIGPAVLPYVIIQKNNHWKSCCPLFSCQGAACKPIV